MALKPVKYNESTKKYDVRYRYVDYTGKSHSTTKRGFETEELALKFYYKTKLENMDTNKINLTFGQLTELYFEDCKKFKKYSTIRGDKYKLKYLCYFNKFNACSITYEMIYDYRNKLIKSKLSSDRINRIFSLMKLIYQFGFERYNINNNCVNRLKILKKKTNKQVIDFYTNEEFEKFINVFPKDPTHKHYVYRVCFMIMYWLGLRPGEAIALNFNDINFKFNYIRVDETNSITENGRENTTTKTEGSTDILNMPAVLKNLLTEYVKYINFRSNSNEPLLKFRNKRINSRSLENNNKKYSKLAGIKKIRLQDFRHSFASLIYDISNGDYVEVANRLRHTSVETCIRTYIHVFPKKKNHIDKVLNEF